MNYKRVSDHRLKALRALQDIRDQAAYRLGAALLELRVAERKACTEEKNEDQLKLRLGALYLEFETMRKHQESVVNSTYPEQERVGELALREAEVDFDAGRYTIDLVHNGLILKMEKGGDWKLLSEEEQRL